MSKQTQEMNAENRIREVAERIMRLREDLGISVENMAAKTDYSVDDYKKFEAGEKDSASRLSINARMCFMLRLRSSWKAVLRS